MSNNLHLVVFTNKMSYFNAHTYFLIFKSLSVFVTCVFTKHLTLLKISQFISNEKFYFRCIIVAQRSLKCKKISQWLLHACSQQAKLYFVVSHIKEHCISGEIVFSKYFVSKLSFVYLFCVKHIIYLLDKMFLITLFLF